MRYTHKSLGFLALELSRCRHLTNPIWEARGKPYLGCMHAYVGCNRLFVARTGKLETQWRIASNFFKKP